jgi:hypothetical protein
MVICKQSVAKGEITLESSVKQLSWAKQQFERVVVKAKKALNNGNLLSAVAWAQIGADFARHRHPGFYTNIALESLLLDVANDSIGDNQNFRDLEKLDDAP